MTGPDASSSTTTTNPSSDPSSPYYIHPIDYPRKMHVNETLTDSNYANWSREMSDLLLAKNRAGFIDGTLPLPEEGSKDMHAWLRSDAIIKGWLMTAMEKDIRNSVKYATTAKQICDDLEERFGKESAPRAYELKRALTIMRQDNTSVSTYFTKLRGIWDEIQSVSPIPKCTCGKCTCDLGKRLAESKEKERVYEFLMGLDDVFGTIKTQILSTKPTPTLGTTYHLVAEDEQQRNITATRKPTVEAAAFQVRTQPNFEKGTAEKRNVNRENLKCKHCGKTGHVIEGCFEKIGYPDWWETRTKKPEVNQRKNTKPKPKVANVEIEVSPIPGLNMNQYEKLMQQLGNVQKPEINMAGKFNFEPSWVIESGATEHVSCHNLNMIDMKESKDGVPVRILNGDKVPVKGIGSACLPNDLKINDVLYIPEFKCNLLSVSKITKSHNCFVTLFLDFWYMQDLHSRKLIRMGKCENGLYGMERMNGRAWAMAIKVDSEVWHKRLGHASHNKLRNISDIGSVVNIEHCDSCIRAKQTRLPFV